MGLFLKILKSHGENHLEFSRAHVILAELFLILFILLKYLQYKHSSTKGHSEKFPAQGNHLTGHYIA